MCILTLAFAHAIHHMSHTRIKQTIQGQIDKPDYDYGFRVYVPRRIHSRWSKHLKMQGLQVSKVRVRMYSIETVLKMAGITSDEFAKCWKFMGDNATDDELFRLFKEAGFGTHSSAIAPKIDFLSKVLQRYEDAKVCVLSACVQSLFFRCNSRYAVCTFLYAFAMRTCIYILSHMVDYVCLHDSYARLYNPNFKIEKLLLAHAQQCSS